MDELRTILSRLLEEMSTKTAEDHDILITLQQISKQLAEVVSDHEKRMRRMERLFGYGLGALAFIELLHTSDVWMKMFIPR